MSQTRVKCTIRLPSDVRVKLGQRAVNETAAGHGIVSWSDVAIRLLTEATASWPMPPAVRRKGRAT